MAKHIGCLFGLLVLAFVAAEIATLIFVGEGLGVPVTLLAIFGTAAIGLLLAKKQGRGVIRLLRAAGKDLQAVTPLAIEGIGIAIAAILLLIPGFITDSFGILLLMPQLRRWLIGGLINFRKDAENRTTAENMQFSNIIDVEEDQYENLESDDKR